LLAARDHPAASIHDQTAIFHFIFDLQHENARHCDQGAPGETTRMSEIGAAVRYFSGRTNQIAWWAVAVAALALSIPFWQAVVAERQHVVAQQIEYEDEALCLRLGFALGTDTHAACKAELLNLRRDHEQLLSANSLP
jgi:hypothetical protein